MNRLRVLAAFTSIVALAMALSYYILKKQFDESYAIAYMSGHNIEMAAGIVGSIFIAFNIGLMIWKRQLDWILVAQLVLIAAQFAQLGTSQYFWNNLGSKLKLLVLGLMLSLVVIEIVVVTYFVYNKLAKLPDKTRTRDKKLIKY